MQIQTKKSKSFFHSALLFFNLGLHKAHLIRQQSCFMISNCKMYFSFPKIALELDIKVIWSVIFSKQKRNEQLSYYENKCLAA